jgi:hypothetical protein
VSAIWIGFESKHVRTRNKQVQTGLKIVTAAGVSTFIGEGPGGPESAGGATSDTVFDGIGIDTSFFFFVGADKNAGSAGSAGFASPSISLIFLGSTAAAVAEVNVIAGAATDAVTGSSVGFEKSENIILNTDGVFGAVFASLSVLFTALSLTVAAVAAAGVGLLAGSATDAVASELVRTEMFLDDAILDTGGVGGTNYSSHLVLFVFSDVVTGALVGFGMSSDGVFLSEASK